MDITNQARLECRSERNERCPYRARARRSNHAVHPTKFRAPHPKSHGNQDGNSSRVEMISEIAITVKAASKLQSAVAIVLICSSVCTTTEASATHRKIKSDWQTTIRGMF